MKICFLLIAIDHLAGTERAAVAQANALADRHDVEIISVLRGPMPKRNDIDPRVRRRYLTSADPEVARSEGLMVIDRSAELAEAPSTLVSPRWDARLNALCDVALWHFLPTLDVDVVTTLTPGMLAAAVQCLPDGIALAHQEHRSSMHRTIGLEPLLAFAPRTDAIVSLTQANAVWLRRQLGSQAPPTYVVPNAAPGREQPQSLLDAPVIVAAGRLSPDKQHRQLISAFGSIADEIPDWRLRIFGSGPLRPMLLKSARRHRLYDRVELPGAVADLSMEWARASISALTSRQEGLPLVIQESFAAGVPVVAYDCPTGPSELIEHGVNGFLVPLGNQQLMAGHLLELAQDRELRRRMGKAARETANRYDRTEITAQWEQIFIEAVAGRRVAGAPWLTRHTSPSRGTRREAAVVPPELTPWELRRHLMRTIALLLADVQGWFVLPARGPRPPTVVVPSDRRPELLTALECSDWPSHVSLAVLSDDHWLPRRGPVSTTARQVRSTLVEGFAIEPWPEGDGAPTHLASGAGIRVEFWGRDQAGHLNASRTNPFARRVTVNDIVAGQVEGMAVPTVEGLAGPFVDECQFPIDIVYTWVDDSDPEWCASRDRALGMAPGLSRKEASGAARFRNRDELRYSLRSLHAYAPWVRTIHIVTAGQRPAWLLDHPKVQLVDHRDILPSDALPTFNSHAIETGLHKVPGVSEHFIYLNDDVFLARTAHPERFFAPSGNFATFFSDTPVGVPGGDNRPHVVAGLNNRRLIEERYGVTSTHLVAHTPHPMRKSVLEELCTEFAEAVDRTARASFRSPTDVTVTAGLVQHYGLIKGVAYSGELDLRFVNLSQPNVKARLRGLLARDSDVFCLADHHDYAMTEYQFSRILTDFLESYYPTVPPWEEPIQD